MTPRSALLGLAMVSIAAATSGAVDVPKKPVTAIDYIGSCRKTRTADFVVPGESVCLKPEYSAIGQADDGDAERQHVAAPLLNYKGYFGGCSEYQSEVYKMDLSFDIVSPPCPRPLISVGAPGTGLTIGR